MPKGAVAARQVDHRLDAPDAPRRNCPWRKRRPAPFGQAIANPDESASAPSGGARAPRQSNLRLGARTSASPFRTTVLPTDATVSRVTRRLRMVNRQHRDLCRHHIAGADGGHELQALAQIDRCHGPATARRSPPRSGRRSACHARCGPRRWCPGHRRRPDAPGCGRSRPRQTSSISRSVTSLVSDRRMPISRSSMQIVPRGWLCVLSSIMAIPLPMPEFIADAAVQHNSFAQDFCSQMREMA